MPAMWIAPTLWYADADPISPSPFLFRKDVELKTTPASATIRITAHWRYALYINGTAVHHGPARGYPSRQYLDVLDIARYLKAGRNAIAVYVLTSAGATGYSVVARPGLFVEGQISDESETIAITSDNSWHVISATWISSQGFMTSLATGTQEHHDFSRRPVDVLTKAIKPPAPLDPNVPPPLPSSPTCTLARIIGPVMTPPFLAMEPRPIPLLREEPIVPVLFYAGKTSTEKVEGNLTTTFNQTAITGQKTKSTLANEKIMLDTRGENLITLDFGRTRLIRPGLEILSADPEVRLELHYDLGFNEKENRPVSMVGFGSECEGFCDTVSPPASAVSSPIDFSTLQVRGFRFMTLKLTGEGTCTLRLACRSVDYPFASQQPGPRAVQQDSALAKIWAMSADTLRSSANDTFVDTCSRENVLWTMDGCFQGKAAFYTFGETQLWRRCLSLIAQGIDPHGIPHAVVPSQDSFMILFDQAFYFVHSCKEYFERTHDNRLIGEVYHAVVRLLMLAKKHITSEDLFVPPAYSWHFVDWAPIPKRAYSLPVNLMLIMAFEAAASFGLTSADQKGFQAMASRMRTAAMRFWDEEAGCFCNHIEPAMRFDIGMDYTFNYDPNEAKNTLAHGIHANGLALALGLPPLGSPEQRQRVAQWMCKMLAKPLCPENTFGPGWTDLLLSPLFDHGAGEQALAFIKRVYGQLMSVEAPTWPENFGPEKYNTAHGWGASVNSLLAMKL